MFRSRHGLLAVRTMASLSREVFGRMATVRVFGDQGQDVIADTVDQFNRIGTMADGQREYLQGVIEYQQARTNTKIAIAAERLAVIAAVTLPITALSSALGMNIIANEATDPIFLAVVISLDGCDVGDAAHLVQAQRLVVASAVDEVFGRPLAPLTARWDPGLGPTLAASVEHAAT